MDNNYPLFSVFIKKYFMIDITRELIHDRIQNFRKVMKIHNLPITPQKLSIFQFLSSTKSHPNAQEIYKRMQTYFPSISFATIYKNLKKFSDLRLVRSIEMKNGIARYDANMDPHHHIINLTTNEVIDLDTQDIGEVHIPKDVTKYELDSVSINFFVRNKPQTSRYERLRRRKLN
jgi:Fur family peroxide stress response transcriptional regulator